MARLVVAGVGWLLLVPVAGRGQACAEPHYRWSEKVATTLQTRPPTAVDVAEILTNCAPLGFTNKDRCPPRMGRADGSPGRPPMSHAVQPPTSARALLHPARCSSRVTRTLVSSSLQLQ